LKSAAHFRGELPQSSSARLRVWCVVCGVWCVWAAGQREGDASDILNGLYQRVSCQRLSARQEIPFFVRHPARRAATTATATTSAAAALHHGTAATTAEQQRLPPRTHSSEDMCICASFEVRNTDHIIFITAARNATAPPCQGGRRASMHPLCVCVCVCAVSSRSSAAQTRGPLGWSISALC